MNTEIQTFNFNAASLRTITEENGNPWFVGKDVAAILGYTNPRKALIDHRHGATHAVSAAQFHSPLAYARSWRTAAKAPPPAHHAAPG